MNNTITFVPEITKIQTVQKNLARTKERLKSVRDELRWVKEDGKELKENNEFDVMVKYACDAAKNLNDSLEELTKILIEATQELR